MSMWVKSGERALHGLASLALLCSCLGAPAQQGIASSQQEAADAGARLKELSLAELGTVRVTTVSKQPEELWRTAAAVTVLTQDDIRRAGVTSIPELLRLVPGVDVARTQSTSWAVGIRGFNSSFSRDILVLIDGRSVYTPLFEGVYWDVQDLPMAEIERVEIVRGPGGTIWGANAVNGVINIITRKAGDLQGKMTNVNGGGPVARFTGTVGYGFRPSKDVQARVWARGFDHGPEWNPTGDPYDHAHQERGGFRADWQPSSADSFSASGMIYRGLTGGQISVAQFSPSASRTVEAPQTVSGGDVVVRFDHLQAGGSSFFAQAYFDRTNRSSVQYSETRDTFDVDLNEHIANLPGQDVLLGADLRSSPSNVYNTQFSLSFSPQSFNNYVFSLYGQDAFRLIPDKLILTLGSKFIDDAYSGWGVEPSAQLLWRPRPRTTLWGSVDRALRTPGRLDRDASVTLYSGTLAGRPLYTQLLGDDNFQPEVMIGWNVGFRQLLWQKLYIDLAAFHTQYDGVQGFGRPGIAPTLQTSPYPYYLLSEDFTNALRGVSDGIEIAPDWKPKSWLELRGNFSHAHVNLHSRPGFAQNSSSVDQASPHRIASLQAILSLPHGWELVPDYRFVSRLPAENVTAYQTADLRAAYRISEHLEASVNGRNLLQPHHHEFLGNNNNAVGIKREVYGGLGWLW